ncbi:aminotransferase class I/II-fold pyridoxal phosphate-dependent enzyme [Georgenia halophila]|uniref:cysteine-S-conjugate beta-lyase n=1 Tax=Georgenia halophila TaxID=620889 RepID=A0ABP8KU44_9MICO
MTDTPTAQISAQLDSVTVDALREVGGVKWSTFPESIGAFIAEMDYGTAPAVSRALHDAVDRGLLGYLPKAVGERMSAACAGWQRTRYGWDVPAERVRPLPDVLAGAAAAIEHFSTPGSPIILPTPAYMPFLTLPKILGREIIEVPMAVEDGRYVYDLDALDRAFGAGGNLLVLCNPHNPIGRVLERDEMLAVAEVVERHGGRVFSDEIHSPLVFPEHQHLPYASISEETARHTVTSTSASKAWNLPGMKCAQLILSNDADAEVWSSVGPTAEHGAATLGVVANTAAYTSGGQWLDDVIGYLDGNRRLLGELLADRIPEIGYTAPEGTYLTLLDCRALDLGDHPAQFFLREAKVAMTDGALCGEAARGMARFNMAMPRPVLEEAVDQMAEALGRR